MTLHNRWINGNVALWDTHQNRIIDAWGATVTKFLEEFVATDISVADAPAGWTTTLVELGAGESTVALTDGVGGLLLITADENENDGAQMQKIGESFKLAASKPCYLGIRAALSENTQTDFFFGLATTDTTIIAGEPDDYAGFRKHDGDANIDCVTCKNTTSTSTDSTVDVVNATYNTLEMYFDGNGSVYFYIDGVLKVTNTTNIPDDEDMKPSIAFLSGAAGAGKTCTVDWIRVIQFN